MPKSTPRKRSGVHMKSPHERADELWWWIEFGLAFVLTCSVFVWAIAKVKLDLRETLVEVIGPGDLLALSLVLVGSSIVYCGETWITCGRRFVNGEQHEILNLMVKHALLPGIPLFLFYMLLKDTVLAEACHRYQEVAKASCNMEQILYSIASIAICAAAIVFCRLLRKKMLNLRMKYSLLD